jgi:hypothetical protein
VTIIKRKTTKDTMQSEQFQNPIEKWYKDAKYSAFSQSQFIPNFDNIEKRKKKF